MQPDTEAITAKIDALTKPNEDSDKRQPWFRQDGEPNDAYEAFFFFRSLPSHNRHINGAFRQLLAVRYPERLSQYKQPSNAIAHKAWQRWYETWDWERRAVAWDDAVRDALMNYEVEGLEEMLDRHGDNLRKLQRWGMEALKTDKFDKHPAAALRAVHHSQTMERELAGLPQVAHLMLMGEDDLVAHYKKLFTKDGGVIEAEVTEGEPE